MLLLCEVAGDDRCHRLGFVIAAHEHRRIQIELVITVVLRLLSLVMIFTTRRLLLNRRFVLHVSSAAGSIWRKLSRNLETAAFHVLRSPLAPL